MISVDVPEGFGPEDFFPTLYEAEELVIGRKASPVLCADDPEAVDYERLRDGKPLFRALARGGKKLGWREHLEPIVTLELDKGDCLVYLIGPCKIQRAEEPDAALRGDVLLVEPFEERQLAHAGAAPALPDIDDGEEVF